jgi:hypothetical protein
MPELRSPNRPALLTAARVRSQRSNSAKSSAANRMVVVPEPAGRPADGEAEHRGADQPLRLRDRNKKLTTPSQASMQIAALAARRSPPGDTQNR